ncbi:MAG: cation transporter [Magnetococcales bacterium]|nr:cation transporter [Magnetococcales bacterium]
MSPTISSHSAAVPLSTVAAAVAGQSAAVADEEALPPFWLEPGRTVRQECQGCRIRVVWWDLFVSLGDACFMALMGWVTGSMALHAQGLQSLGDFFNKGVTLFSIKTAAKPPSRRFPYGFGKIQFLSAAFVGSSLFLGSLAFIYSNMQHINQGMVTPPSVLALLPPLLSIVASFIMYRYLTCVSEKNNNLALIASALDNRQDMYATIALLAGILFSILGFPVADHAAAILVSLFTVQIGFSIANRAIHGLLDGSIPASVLRQIRAVTLQVPGVLGITRLRGRMLGESWEVDLQILVDGALPTTETHQTAIAVRRAIIDQVQYTESVHISVLPQ